MILVGGGIEFCLYGMFCAPLEKILKLEIFWDMIYSILGNIWVTLFCSKLMIDSVKKYLFSVVDHNSQSGWWNMVWQPATIFWLQPLLILKLFNLLSMALTHVKTVQTCYFLNHFMSSCHVTNLMTFSVVWCQIWYHFDHVTSVSWHVVYWCHITCQNVMSLLTSHVEKCHVMLCYLMSQNVISHPSHVMPC